ncbi:helitron_like_N domain-containing protein [Trichonephila clavipes]|nr:helitron_like_N domain-containing protein [Trichonephila clavipes]
MNTVKLVNDDDSTSAAGVVEIMQLDDEIASILTTLCLGISCARQSSHSEVSSARFTNDVFQQSIWTLMCKRLLFLPSLKLTKEKLLPMLNNIFPEDALLVSPRLPFMRIRRLRYDGSYGIIGQVINVLVDVGTMLQHLPRPLDDDQAFNVNIKKDMTHKSTYLSGVVKKSMMTFIGPIPETISFYHGFGQASPTVRELRDVFQTLVAKTPREDSMRVNVPGFNLRPYCNAAKRRQIATISSVVSSSSSRKAGGIVMCRDINSFTNCNKH